MTELRFAVPGLRFPSFAPKGRVALRSTRREFVLERCRGGAMDAAKLARYAIAERSAPRTWGALRDV